MSVENTKKNVPGDGPAHAERMIIGEAPGKDEVVQGTPFVGKSGRLLDQALNELGVERSGCYVTNVVKFRPISKNGKTRPPTFQEASWAYHNQLIQEYNDVRPKKLLLLGRIAQEWSPGFEVDVVEAWHPAYVLRRGGHGSEAYKEWIEQLRPFS